MRPRQTWWLWLLLSPAIFCIVWPVWFVLTAALRSPDELICLFGPALGFSLAGTSGSTWTLLPNWPTLQPLCELLLDCPEFYIMLWNSTIQTFPQIIGALFVSAPAAWALARYSFRGRGFVLFLYFILLALPFQVSMVPTSLVLRNFGLMDTQWAVILPGIFSTFPVFLLLKGFSHIPIDCLDAARLDGANDWICFFRIGLPICSQTIFVTLTIQFWECWNSIEQPLAFLRSESLWPLSLYLPQLTTDNFALSCAASLIILVPPLLMFRLGSSSLLSDIERGILK